MKRIAPVFVIKQQINAQARLQFLIKRPALVFVISLAHSATSTLIQEAVPVPIAIILQVK